MVVVAVQLVVGIVFDHLWRWTPGGHLWRLMPEDLVCWYFCSCSCVVFLACGVDGPLVRRQVGHLVVVVEGFLCSG